MGFPEYENIIVDREYELIGEMAPARFERSLNKFGKTCKEQGQGNVY